VEAIEGLAYEVLKLGEYLSELQVSAEHSDRFDGIDEPLQNIRRLEDRFLNLDLTKLDALGMLETFFLTMANYEPRLKEAYVYLSYARESYKSFDKGGVTSNCRSAAQYLDNKIKDAYGENSFTYKERWGRIYGNGKAGFNHWVSMPLHFEQIKKEGAGDNRYNEPEFKITNSDVDTFLLVTMALIKFAEGLVKEKSSGGSSDER
jgi:hypothetical protein